MTPTTIKTFESFSILRAIIDSLINRGMFDDSVAWTSSKVQEPNSNFGFYRLDFNQLIEVANNSSARLYQVSLHCFPDNFGIESEMHDHLFPFMVLPFHYGIKKPMSQGPIYRMKWRDSRQNTDGEQLVKAGEPYFVDENTDFKHSVCPATGTMSLIIADRTNPASRQPRMNSKPCEFDSDGLLYSMKKAVVEWSSQFNPSVSIREEGQTDSPDSPLDDIFDKLPPEDRFPIRID